jgi:hypothetical protein
MIQLIEVVENAIPVKNGDRFHLREIYISPEHIVMVREDTTVHKYLAESKDTLPDLSRAVGFSKLTINQGTTGQQIVVVGSVNSIYEKIESSKIRNKQLLRG